MTRTIRHAFVVRDATPVPPFEVPAGDVWLLDRSLRDRSRGLLAARGLSVDEVATVADAETAAAGTAGGAIIVLDSVAFSAAVLGRLLDAFAASRAPALSAALPAAVSTRVLSHIDGLAPVTIDGAEAFT